MHTPSALLHKPRDVLTPEEIRQLRGMDPEKLGALRRWLMRSDNRNFAADLIRHGYLVLEVERVFEHARQARI